MSFHELQFILCIARHQNLTRAAQELYISQPTLTKCLQKVEREVDGKLFNRSDNRYYPTQLGEKYLEYARSVLALEENFRNTAMCINSSQRGELSVAFPIMRSFCMVPRIIKEFRSRFPGVTLNIYEEATEIQNKLLMDLKIDFAIFSDAFPNPKLTYEQLFEDNHVLVLPPDHPLAQRGEEKEGFSRPWLDLSLAAKEPFILHFPEQTTGVVALRLFEEYNIEPNVVLRIRNATNMLRLCQQGVGLCFTLESYVRAMEFDRPPVCFAVGSRPTGVPLQVAYRKGTVLSPCARAFIEIAKRC